MRQRSRAAGAAALLVVLISLALGSCATRPVSYGSATPMGAILTVERFLQAASDRDLDTMARLFGTAGGPVADETGSSFGCAFKRMGSWIGLSERCLKRTEIELRMNAIALVLRHDDYRILSEERVAGREHPTTRVGVTLILGEREFSNVPFVCVQTSEGAWLVEEIGLTQITGT